MLTRELAPVALLLFTCCAVSGGDCRRRYAIDFWSDIVCSIKNCKTVNIHYALDNSGDSALARRCFHAFTYAAARKCETTIVSRTHALPNSEDTFADDNDEDEAVVRSSQIRKLASGDVFACRRRSTAEKIPTRDDRNETYGQDTWHVHALLVKDTRSFELIARNGSTFEWNTQDRVVVLIAHRERRRGESKIDDILKMLWSERRVHNVFVSEAIFTSDASRTDRLLRTYNPFARVNDSAWGKIEIVRVNATGRASNALSGPTYRRTADLNGYELKVGMFDRNQSRAEGTANSLGLYSPVYEYSDIFKGFDETILETIARRMNFKARRVHPTDDAAFGYQLRNGTYVGAIGDVVHGRTDVCFKSFFVKKYGADAEHVEFTEQVEFDRLCVVVPKAPKVPKWLRIYHFFPLSVWICSMLSHVLASVTWHLLQILNPRRTGRVSFLATAYRSFLLNAGCPQKLPSATAERILLTGVFLAGITLVGIFNGILYNSFAHDMHYKDIDSLEELDASGLPIAFGSLGVSDLFGSDETDVDDGAMTLTRNLRLKLRHDYNGMNNAAYRRNVSGLMRESHFPVMNEKLIDESGSPLLHLVEECPDQRIDPRPLILLVRVSGRFYISYLLPKDSILRERINVLIGRLNQAGLPALWNSRTIYRSVAKKRKKTTKKKKKLPATGTQSEHKTDRFVAFNLSDVQTSFYMLLMGLSLSTMVFLYEKGWFGAPLSRDAVPSSGSTR